MSTHAKLRLINDLKRFYNRDEVSNLYAQPRSDNLLIWEAVIFGPEETIWDGGCFKLILEFNEEYPVKPPDVRFCTTIFHPNVYNDGKICLDILNNQWSSIFDVRTILESIQSLLGNPNPNSPANAEAARLFIENKKEYNKKVMECVENSWKVWKGISADEIQRRVLKSVEPGSIILFHNAAENTPAALPGIIEALLADGYHIVPISQIILTGEYMIDNTGKQCPK